MKAKNDGLLRINRAVAPYLVWTHVATRETEAFLSSEGLGRGNEKATTFLSWTFTQKTSVGGL